MFAGAVTTDLNVSACRTNPGQRLSSATSSVAFGVDAPDMEVGVAFVPFMRQAGLCITTAWGERPQLPSAGRAWTCGARDGASDVITLRIRPPAVQSGRPAGRTENILLDGSAPPGQRRVRDLPQRRPGVSGPATGLAGCGLGAARGCRRPRRRPLRPRCSCSGRCYWRHLAGSAHAADCLGRSSAQRHGGAGSIIRLAAGHSRADAPDRPCPGCLACRGRTQRYQCRRTAIGVGVGGPA